MNKKKILVTSTELMMLHFLIPHINNLIEKGYDVEIACSEVGGRFQELYNKFIKKIVIHKVELYRSPLKIRNLIGLTQLKQIINNGNYDLLWTNEPVMGVMTRLAARNMRKRGMKLVYIAHGFHFYDGAPMINWLIYYPIEKLMSCCTDVIVTINQEDFKRAGEKFYAKTVKYIHGIGLDTDKYRNCIVDKEAMKKIINIPQNAFILFSVGELSSRKNHKLIIEALGMLKNKNIYYIIAGRGNQEEYIDLAKNNKIEEQLILLGNRNDIDKLCKIADVFVHPSAREGLGIAALEGMASGLPMISTNVNGMKDYVKDNITGCVIENKDDVKAAEKAIDKMYQNKEFRKICGENNIDISSKFDLKISMKDIERIIQEQLN